MPSRRNAFAFLGILVWCFILLATSGEEACADPSLYYDASGTTSVWNYTTSNWSEIPGGPYNRTWSDWSDAQFGGIGGTVNVATTIAAVNSISFGVEDYTLSGGTLNLVGNLLGYGTPINTDYGANRIDSVLSGTVGLNKTGSGSLTLGGVNTFTGSTTISNGTLRLDHVNALHNSVFAGGSGYLSFGTLTAASFSGLSGDYYSNLVLMNENNAPVSLTVGSGNQSTSYYGGLSGLGSLIKVGTGTLILVNTEDFMGDTVLRSGQLMLCSYFALQNSTLDAQGGALAIQYPSDPLPFVPGAQLGGLKGSGNLDLNVKSLDVGFNDQSTVYGGILSGSVGLGKFGGGTLTLSGANTFTGITSIYSGLLRLDNENALQNSTFCGSYGLSFGTLTAANLGGLRSGDSSTLVLMNEQNEPVALSVGNNNQSTIYNGYLDGTGSLIKIGTGILTLTHCCDFGGDTVLRTGTIMLGDPNALQNSTLDAQGGALASEYFFARLGGLKGNGNLHVDIDSLEVGGNNQSTIYTGVLSGTTGLCKMGTGTLTLGGANNFTGTTSISGGILHLDNTDALQNSTVCGNMESLSFGTLTSATFGGLSGGSNAILGLMNESEEPVSLSVGGNNQSTTYNGDLAGPGSLVKIGTGMLTLSGVAGHYGDTVLRAGTLVLGRFNDLHSSTIDAQGGGLGFTDPNQYPIQIGGLKGSGDLRLDIHVFHVGFNDQSTIYAGELSGTTGLSKQGFGTLTLAGANTFTGTTSVASGGTLRLDNVNALQNSTFCGGSGLLSFGSLTSATLGGLSGDSTSTISLLNDLGEPVALSVGNNNRSTIYNGSFSGSGSVTKIGSGIWTLSSAGSFWGDMVLRSGTIILGDALALQYSTLDAQGGALCLGTTTATLGGLKGSGNLNLDGDTLIVGTNGQSTTYSGVLSGATGLRKRDMGVLTLSGANTFTGETLVTQGTLRMANPYALQNSTFCGGNLSFGTLTAATLGGLGGRSVNDLFLMNDSHAPVALSVGNNNQSTEYCGVLSGPGSLIKIGTGTLALSGSSHCFTGDTVILDGTLMLAQRLVLQDSTVDIQGGELVIAYPEVVLGGLEGYGDVNLSACQVEVGNNHQSTTYGGVFSGSQEFCKVGGGTLTLAGANTFTGTTSISYGTLRLDNAIALQNSIFAGGSGCLSFGTLSSATFGGLSNSYGSLALTNELGEPVALSLGNNQQSTYSFGQLDGAGSLMKIGLNALFLDGYSNYAGLTTVQSGMLELGPGAQLPVLSGAGADVQGGMLTLDYGVGATSLASTVRAALASGQIFCSTADGNGALGWIDDIDQGKVSIMYTLLGDANLDHSVNGTDLNAVLSNYNASDMGWSDGDFNYDGSVNGTDLNAILSNYNQSLPASVVAVPEPSVWLLMVLGVAFWGAAVCRRFLQSNG